MIHSSKRVKQDFLADQENGFHPYYFEENFETLIHIRFIDKKRKGSTFL